MIREPASPVRGTGQSVRRCPCAWRPPNGIKWLACHGRGTKALPGLLKHGSSSFHGPDTGHAGFIGCMTISSVPPSSPFIPLDAYAKAAAGGQDIYVDIAGEPPQVLGMSATPGGRNAAWVAPDVDTATMFAQALAQRYGQAIASAVAHELELEPNPGKPLSAAAVAAAIDMAETSSHALSGVDFMIRLAISAAGNTPAFQQACGEAGVAPSSLDAVRRNELDVSMQARFDQAARSGLSPVSLGTAAEWLRDLLKES